MNSKKKRTRFLIFLIISVILSLFYFFVYENSNFSNLVGNSFKEQKCVSILENETETFENLTVSFINVSQGDAIFLENMGQTMLIDCGNNGKGGIILDYFKKNNISKLDYLIITHTDADHIGGCDEILREINAKIIFMDGQSKDTQSYEDVVEEAKKQNIQIFIPDKCFSSNLGKSKFQIIHGNVGSEYANQNSLVLTLRYGNSSFLFTGDCDGDCEKSMLNQKINIDFLKIAHHGSPYGTSKEFLKKTSPFIAFISVGKNSYGHPSEEVLNRLQDNQINLYRTDFDGTIILKTDGKIYWVLSG